MSLNSAIAKRIKEILKQKLISQYKLEKMAGIPHSTMSGLLNSMHTGCNLKTVFLIIYALGMTPAEFFDHPIFEECNIVID